MPMMMPDQQAGMPAMMNNLGLNQVAKYGGWSMDLVHSYHRMHCQLVSYAMGPLIQEQLELTEQSVLGCIFLPIGFMILIIFTAVGLYDSKWEGYL